jgi:DNA-binding MarR family transcriptional regulator
MCPSAGPEPAREAWRLLQALARAERGRLPRVCAELDLAPAQAIALCSLQPGEPVAMSGLAGALACDNSNVTGLIDRLEQRGLVRRRPASHDRRVKMLVVTSSGARTRARLVAALSEPPAALAALAAADQRALLDILGRAVARTAGTRS